MTASRLFSNYILIVPFYVIWNNVLGFETYESSCQHHKQLTLPVLGSVYSCLARFPTIKICISHFQRKPNESAETKKKIQDLASRFSPFEYSIF